MNASEQYLIPELWDMHMHAQWIVVDPDSPAAARRVAEVAPVQEERIVRLVYYLVDELVDAPERPRWNAVGLARVRAGEP